MTSIPMIDLFTIIFVLVDDWYKSKGAKLVDQSQYNRRARALRLLMEQR